VILGVSFDTAAENKAFAEKFHFNFPLLCDTTRAMGQAYGAADPGQTDGFARRVGVVIGPDARIRHWFAKVDAKSFPDAALTLL